MKKWIDQVKNEFIKAKKAYVFLGILVLIGIVTGSFFMTLLDKSDKLLVSNQITEFMSQVGNMKHMDFMTSLQACTFGNLLNILGVFLLGISIVGIPFVLFFLYFRGFVVGFSIGAIISIYQWKGLLIGFLYIFPHHIINLLLLMVLSRYAIVFSMNLFYALTNKKGLKLNLLMRRYLKVLLVVVVLVVFSSLLEVYVTPYLLKFGAMIL